MTTPRTDFTTGLTRRGFLGSTLGLASLAGLRAGRRAFAAEPTAGWFRPQQPLIPAPADPALWPEFRRRLFEWRAAEQQRLAYSDALYCRPDFAWVTRHFACGFLMVCDETFYDSRRGRYSVRAFLDHGRRDFGGYDSVVLWHAYPRIGLDDRNQFDFYRDMPGGLPGLRQVVREFQRRDVRVFLDYNPWDTGTRREGRSDLDALCDLVRDLEADGLFLDTMNQGAAEFRARLDAVRPGVVLEGEIALPLERVHDHHCSWAQWFEDSAVPGVLRNKWFERRHLQHQIRRWDRDHSGELHAAWMNGSGMMIWENVFGSWVGWNPRDRSILRAMLPIQRRFARLFCGEGWTPLVAQPAPEVYASLWEAEGLRLWTLVNRGDRPATGTLPLGSLEHHDSVYDLVRGVPLRPDGDAPSGHDRTGSGIAVGLPSPGSVTVTLRPRGIGCVAVGPKSAWGPGFLRWLAEQARLETRADSITTFPDRATRLRAVKPTVRLSRPPVGMAEIPAARLTLRLEMRVRECGFYESTPSANHPLASSYDFRLETFERRVDLRRFAIDLTPVTNAQFADFLKASGYRPRHRTNFLRHWIQGVPPADRADHPVVYVDLGDARAYARWARKRLPTEEEWQYAAQGTDARKYPWGDTLEPGRCNDGATGTTTPVTTFPNGRSPFGLYDLCGNVWEWTESERSDGRTRFALLKGGSFYTARGSGWYMDGGPRPSAYSAKVLLMWPGLDRAATVGFRCVADLD